MALVKEQHGNDDCSTSNCFGISIRLFLVSCLFGITIAKESRINIAGLWITATIQKYCIKLFMVFKCS